LTKPVAVNTGLALPRSLWKTGGQCDNLLVKSLRCSLCPRAH